MVYDVVVIGAGAAGLMCAAQAGYAGRRVLVVDHANKAGKKILMSGEAAVTLPILIQRLDTFTLKILIFAFLH